MAQRTLSTEVEVKRTGDAGAIRETADDVRDLDRAAEQASGGLGGVASSADRAGRAIRSTGGHAGDAARKLREMDTAAASAGGLGKAFTGVGDKLAKFAGAAKGAIGVLFVFKESFQQARETINFFEREFGISIDNIVRNGLKLDSLAEKFVGTANTIEESAELLRNQQNIFNNLEIDGFSENVEKNAELIAEHMKAIQQSQDDAAAAVQRGQDMLSKLGLNYDELLSDAQTFTDDLSQALELSDLDVEDVAGKIEGEVRRMVTAFETLGKDVPPELAILAGQLDELAAKSEEAGDRAGKGADKAATAFEKLVASARGLNGIDIDKFLADFSHLSETDLTRMIEGLTGLGQVDLSQTASGLANIRLALDGLEPVATRVATWMYSIGNPDLPPGGGAGAGGSSPADISSQGPSPTTYFSGP